MIVYFCKSGPSLFCANHKLLHNTSNKGKILPYNTAIAPYTYEIHITLFRPVFVSSFTLAGIILYVFTPLGWIWRFRKSYLYDALLFCWLILHGTRTCRVNKLLVFCTVFYFMYIFFQVTSYRYKYKYKYMRNSDFLYKLKILFFYSCIFWSDRVVKNDGRRAFIWSHHHLIRL